MKKSILNFLPVVSFVAAAGIFFSCHPVTNGEEKKTDSIALQPEPPVPTHHVRIDSSEFFIDLPETHKINKDLKYDTTFSAENPANYRIDTTLVYYIVPIDSLKNRGEAGMYFGNHPDVEPPRIDYDAKEIKTVFLGHERTWIEYTTEKYVQRETFIDRGNGNFLHVWCYADNLPEVERLFTMVNSITR
jgi:hypothetical protein